MQTLQAKTLQKILRQPGLDDFDFILGIREDTINSFLDAHFRAESQSSSNVYKGGGHIDTLQLSYKYEVKAAATLDVAPIGKLAFDKIFASWLGTVPELARYTDPND